MVRTSRFLPLVENKNFVDKKMKFESRQIGQMHSHTQTDTMCTLYWPKKENMMNNMLDE